MLFSVRMSSLVHGLGFFVFFAIGRFIRIPFLPCSNQSESKSRTPASSRALPAGAAAAERAVGRTTAMRRQIER
jgi:hypothetical protein